MGTHPRHIFSPRLAGRLACGELAVEPALGLVRVAGVSPAAGGAGTPVRVRWRDEYGPGTAAASYPDDRTFLVRMPSYADRRLVRRGVDQALWHRRVITDGIARLIAYRLDAGPRTGLDRFVTDGSMSEAVYEELEVAARHRFYARTWVDALARYFLARQDTGPVLKWMQAATGEAEQRTDQWLTAASVDVPAVARHPEATDPTGQATTRSWCHASR